MELEVEVLVNSDQETICTFEPGLIKTSETLKCFMCDSNDCLFCKEIKCYDETFEYYIQNNESDYNLVKCQSDQKMMSDSFDSKSLNQESNFKNIDEIYQKYCFENMTPESQSSVSVHVSDEGSFFEDAIYSNSESRINLEPLTQTISNDKNIFDENYKDTCFSEFYSPLSSCTNLSSKHESPVISECMSISDQFDWKQNQHLIRSSPSGEHILKMLEDINNLYNSLKNINGYFVKSQKDSSVSIEDLSQGLNEKISEKDGKNEIDYQDPKPMMDVEPKTEEVNHRKIKIIIPSTIEENQNIRASIDLKNIEGCKIKEVHIETSLICKTGEAIKTFPKKIFILNSEDDNFIVEEFPSSSLFDHSLLMFTVECVDERNYVMIRKHKIVKVVPYDLSDTNIPKTFKLVKCEQNFKMDGHIVQTKSLPSIEPKLNLDSKSDHHSC